MPSLYKSTSCHGEPQKAIEKVICEGLKSVVRTKKVVVMNIHLIPCDGDNCNQVQARGMVITKDYTSNLDSSVGRAFVSHSGSLGSNLPKCPKGDPIHHV